MAVIKTIFKGESLSMLFTFPVAYDMARIEKHEVYIGETAFTGTVSGKTIALKLKSDDTGAITGQHRISLWLDDSILGVKKPYLGDIVFSNTNATPHNTSTSNISDIIIPIVISETAITVGDILYNYVKGDKGDPFFYSDFTPAQITELQQPAADAIASIEAVELSVEQAEALRVQAEIDRQTNIGTAIQNAETETQNADTATGLANTATGLANTATGLANDAATNANTKAGLADTAATNANTKAGLANTAATNADNARLAIQTDLGLKLDKTAVKQVLGVSTTDLMSQKAVTDEFDYVKGKISHKHEINILQPNLVGVYFNLNYTTKSTMQTANGSFNSHSIILNGQKAFDFSAMCGGVSMAMAVFFDAYGNKISYVQAGDATYHANVLIKVPAGAYEVIFNWYITFVPILYEIDYNVTSLISDVDDKYKAIAAYNNVYDYSGVGVVAGVVTTGGIVTPGGFSTGLIPVKPNHFYFLSNRSLSAIKSIRCLAANRTTTTKVRVASTGEEPVAGIYYYLPKEDGSIAVSNGQFKTSPTTAYIQITLTSLSDSVIGNFYQIMLEDVGDSYVANYNWSLYTPHTLVVKYEAVKPYLNSLKVLLIGSSHGMNTIGQFPILAHHTGMNIICANAYQGSLSLQQIADYCSSGGNFIGWYKKFYDGIWHGDQTMTIAQMLKDETWDFISIQRGAAEDMTWTAEQAGYLETILAYITANCESAPTVVFNSGFADSYSLDQRASQQADSVTIWSTAQEVKTNYGIDIIPVAPILQLVRNNDTLAGLGSYADKMLSCDSQHLDQGIGLYVTGCICFNFFLNHLRRSILSCNYLPTIADMTPFWYEVGKFTAIDEQYAKEIRRIVNLNS